MPTTSSTNDKVLLMSLDNLRYDCVSYIKDRPHLKRLYLDNLVYTPTLEEIASNSSIFTNCFATSSYTTASHASIFTGLLPPEHGVRPFFYKRLKNDTLTLAEIYRRNGFKTILYTDMFELFHPVGLTKGFDFIFAGDINELFKQLESFKDDKVFCFIHLFDVHEPYIFSQNYNENRYNDEYFEYINNMKGLYKFPTENNDPFSLWNAFSNKTGFNEHIMLPAYIRGINKFDAGRLNVICGILRNMGYFNEENIYSVFADHGEGRITYFEQLVFGHMGELYDEVIRVPLILHAPMVEKKVYDKMVSLADLFVTIPELSGFETGVEAEAGGRDGERGMNGVVANAASSNGDIMAGIRGQSLFKERDFCYAEFCTQNMYNEVMQFLSSVYDRKKAVASMGDRYFLSQRTIRTKNKKFMFIPENIPRAESEKIIGNKNLSDENFIFELFNVVVRKRIGKPEFLHLADGLKTKKFTRQAIYNGMVTSEIYNRVKNYYFDMEKDPMEDNVIPLNTTLADSVKWIEVLNKIESLAVITENLFSAPKTEGGERVKTTEIAPALKNKNTGNEEDKNACSENGLADSQSAMAVAAAVIEEKAALSMEIIKEAYQRFGNAIGLAFTGGKDSSVMLDLVRRTFGGKIPFKVITVDTSAEFPEIREFMDKLKTEWGFEILTYSNAAALKGNYQVAVDKADCCNTLKTAPLKQAIKELKLKALFTGIRRDENEARSDEKYFSKRENPHHFRVHPILHFSENDIWNYIKTRNIPFCSLYGEGYRSIDCAPCTHKVADTGVAERSGRSGEKEAAMEKLRKLGYF